MDAIEFDKEIAFLENEIQSTTGLDKALASATLTYLKTTKQLMDQPDANIAVTAIALIEFAAIVVGAAPPAVRRKLASQFIARVLAISKEA